ncbi:hypothetical protein SAMN05421810_105305 [Amycolatopsis arida]|uniref:Uncharacterized protein n=1 Tax=Amycolatopsis arida TaxID=587909 RepID=A0A1I5WW04_9PSEU|nr:hypothetical protein CLV69_105324 [Amycolatopsis arida]SFQ23869.1 hypothetical protein SAMN05421810_105305 [Amycolatopsis arida]
MDSEWEPDVTDLGADPVSAVDTECWAVIPAPRRSPENPG